MSKVKAIESPTKDEMIQLKMLKEQEIGKFKKTVEERFDSKKNWSIMINPKDNDTRNQIMQKVKFEQLKRRCLHDFMRKTREEILKERAAGQEPATPPQDEVAQIAAWQLPSTNKVAAQLSQ